MNRFFIFWIINLICFFLLESCVYPDSFRVPSILCDEPQIGTISSMTFLEKHLSDIPKQVKEDIIIEGYIVSDDRHRNFYKTLYLQSKNRDIGIAIKLDGFNLYSKYSVGRKLYVKLKGLSYYRQYGQIAVGVSSSGSVLNNIATTSFDNYLLRSCKSIDEKDLVTMIRIGDISDKQINTLVKIEDVQFVKESVHQALYNPQKNIGSATNHLIEDRKGYNIIIRTSAYSDFNTYKIPANSGDIVAVLGKYKNDYQLFLRSVNDIQFSSKRFFINHISIAALKTKTYDDIFTQPHYIEGVVTLSGYSDNKNKNSRNISEKLAIIQDEAGAVALYFDKDLHQLIEGDLVRIYLSGYNLDTYGGQLRVETLDFDGRSKTGLKHVQVISSNNSLPKAKEVTLEALIKGDYPLELVKVKNVQISAEYRGLTFSGKKSLTDCKNNMYLKTSSRALFLKEQLPDGRGSLIGICNASKEIIIRNLTGLSDITEDRCDETTLYFGQDFEAIKEGKFELDGWYNISDIGDKYWEVNTYGSNHYIQSSSYNLGKELQTWLITPPLDLSKANDPYLRFRTKDGYNKGKVLSVYISTDFDGVNFSKANWNPLEAEISNYGFSGYATLFKDSGKIDLSRYKKEKVFIGFRYKGDKKITTTMQIDDIQIFSK